MTTKNAYRLDIDGLRAIAVLSVLVFHAFPDLLPGGFVGVDVFFVISGYLITGIILNGLEVKDFSLVRFYARRVRRIFPALALVIGSCLVAGWFLLLPGEFEQLGKHAGAGAAFVSNIILWRESGYFEDAASRTVLLHLWSLGIEEQFYLTWPILMIVGWKLKWPVSVIIAVALVTSFACNLMTVAADPVTAFYSPITRAWEILAGALLAATTIHRSWSPVILSSLSIAGAALIAISAFWLSESDAFPGWRAAIPVLGAAAVIAGGPDTVFSRLLSMRLPVWIGKISYPLYLWHWPLLVFPTIIIGEDLPADWRLLALAASFILATATYRLLERPLHGDGALLPKAAILVLCVGSLGALGALAYKFNGLPYRPPLEPYMEMQAWLDTRMEWPYAENKTCLDRFPSADRREGWSFCIMEEDAPPTVMLMGNSFANHLYPGLASALSDENVLQFGTCDPGLGLRFSYAPAHPCYGEGRQRQEEMVSNIIKDNPSIHHAILSAPWPYFNTSGDAVDYFDPSKIEGQYRSVDTVAGETSYDAFMAALERRVAFLQSRDIEISLVLMTPELGYDPRSCYSGRPLRPSDNSCEVNYQAEMAKQKRFREGVNEIVTRYPALKVFDPLPVFCAEQTCSLRGADGPLLRDVGHLSQSGSQKLAEAFVEWNDAVR